jgi:hypothetical protein
MSLVKSPGQDAIGTFDLFEALQNLPGAGRVDAPMLPDPADWCFSTYQRLLVISSKSCTHDIPAALKENLDCINELCPPCLIKSRVADIKETQAGLEARGGVFASKGQARVDNQWKNHRDWMKKWTALKIKRAAVSQFEQVQSAFPEQSEAWGINQALEIWDMELEKYGKVPGYIYVAERPHEAPTEEIKIAKNDEVNIVKDIDVKVVENEQAKVVENEPLSSQELDDLLTDNREWCMVKPRRKRNQAKKTNNSKKSELGWLSETRKKAILPTPPAGKSGTDEDTLKETKHVTKQFDKQSKMTTWNCFDAISGVESPGSDTASTPVAPSTLSTRHALPTVCHLSTPPSHPSPATPTPRSALKRSNSPRTPNRHIEFSESVTIYPSPTDSTTPSLPIIQTPHNPHTIAEVSRD